MLRRLLSRLPRKELYLEDTLYMTRYYLYEGERFEMYLHDFAGPDPDRRDHNHPWPWSLSILLWGSYMERREVQLHPLRGPQCENRHVQWFNYIRGTDFHTITDLISKRVWTLFIVAKKLHDERGSWGFRQWVPTLERWTVEPYTEVNEGRGAYTRSFNRE